MILFVPSTGRQSSATFPIALPGGSRTSRISGSEIIAHPYTGPIGLNTLCSEIYCVEITPYHAGASTQSPAGKVEEFILLAGHTSVVSARREQRGELGSNRRGRGGAQLVERVVATPGDVAEIPSQGESEVLGHSEVCGVLVRPVQDGRVGSSEGENLLVCFGRALGDPHRHVECLYNGHALRGEE